MRPQKIRTGLSRLLSSILVTNSPRKPLKSPDAAPSYLLWVELSTRIATERLHYRSGDEETAAESIYQLFPKVRELMSNHPDAKRFGEIGLDLLNQVLRPYTARWHGWMTESDESAAGPSRFRDEPVRRRFRLELQDLQVRLAGYQKAFKALAENSTVDDLWLRPNPETEETFRTMVTGAEKQPSLGPSFSAGIDCKMAVWSDFEGAVSLETINREEHKFILGRRKKRTGREQPDDGAVEDAIGLAFSGGGIRSATVCLGVTQVLAEKKILGEVDYLSTVSGGGYFGTFLSSYFKQGAAHETPQTPLPIDETIQETFRRSPDGIEAAAVRHLRNNSKYLLNGGPWGELKIAGLMISGIAANLSMILPLALLAALTIYFLNFLGFWGGPCLTQKILPGHAFGSPAFKIFGFVCAVLFAFWITLLGAQRKAVRAPINSWWPNAKDLCSILTLGLAILAAALAIASSVPLIFGGCDFLFRLTARQCGGLFSIFSWKAILAGTGALPFLLGAGSALIKRPGIRNFMVKLFILSGPLFYGAVTIFISLKLGLREGLALWPWWLVLPAALVWMLWSAFVIDINSLGPHGYYRDRLCECYLAWRGDNEQTLLQTAIAKFWSGKKVSAKSKVEAKNSKLQSVGVRLRLPLSALAEPGVAPYHLVNTVVNLPASKNRDLRGRNGDFFILSPLFCGSPVCGYAATKSLERSDPHVDLGTAMAISGAAASTNMGWRTLTNFRFLMAILNVRLGYWLPNVRKLNKEKRGGAGLYYFLAEISGRIQENLNYLNVSDGGHIENLGVYELLRRKCKFIICVHGGADLSTKGSDLQRLERYASIDLGITFSYDLSDLEPNTQKVTRAYAVLIKIIYPGEEIGWMIYLKPAITGTEPQYVLDYRYRNSDFPFDGIINQIFEEEEFEAYRAIGECAAESLFCRELVGNNLPTSVCDWFQRLANNLLPDDESGD